MKLKTSLKQSFAKSRATAHPCLDMATTKPNVHRVYLNDEDTALMKTACQRTELGQSELLSKLVKSALRAVAANDYRLALPLRLKVDDCAGRVNTVEINEQPRK